jgi:hypothetical protein
MGRVGVRYGCRSRRLGEGKNEWLGCIGFTDGVLAPRGGALFSLATAMVVIQE